MSLSQQQKTKEKNVAVHIIITIFKIWKWSITIKIKTLLLLTSDWVSMCQLEKEKSYLVNPWSLLWQNIFTKAPFCNSEGPAKTPTSLAYPARSSESVIMGHRESAHCNTAKHPHCPPWKNPVHLGHGVSTFLCDVASPAGSAMGCTQDLKRVPLNSGGYCLQSCFINRVVMRCNTV